MGARYIEVIESGLYPLLLMRMHVHMLGLTLMLLTVLVGCRSGGQAAAVDQMDPLRARADSLAHANIIVDGHIDAPHRVRTSSRDLDLSERSLGGNFDFVRGRKGGLNAAFMSIYVPVEYQTEEGAAAAVADSLIDEVKRWTERSPEKFAIATSPEDVRRQFEQGVMSLPMGLENGAAIDDMSDLRHFYDRGIRYITLAHAKVNRLSDSSYDTTRTWDGLSTYGETVVRQMNRLGIMVDVSHITDEAFYDVMSETEAPVIASHSSVRVFTPGWERNMNDDMIRRLAENGGVIMISFGSMFLTEEYRKRDRAAEQHVEEYLKENDLSRSDPRAREYIDAYRREHVGYADISDVADHIDHVVELVGVDHVGLGSDFDGVGDALPYGLKDVSEYPNLVYELLKRGYSDDDIEKILGENVLRVWERVEEVAASGDS